MRQGEIGVEHQLNIDARQPRTLRRVCRTLGLALTATLMVGAPALAEPRMMAGTALNMPAIPARAADGSFLTINRGVEPLQALWHVRAALNVAALGCEGAGHAATIAAYNRFLRAQRAPLAAANTAIVTRYKARYGAAWTARYDAYMTSLYNFFSQPFVKSAFCAAAQPIAAETAAVTPASATAFGAGALPRLEAPFTDFYKRYAAYEVALADYTRRIAGDTTPGAPPAPVSPLLDYAALDAASDWQPAATIAVAIATPAPRTISAPRLAMAVPEARLELSAMSAAKAPAQIAPPRRAMSLAMAAPAPVAARPKPAAMLAATASESMVPAAVRTAITRVPVPDVARIDPALSYTLPD